MRIRPEVLADIEAGNLGKGDVLSVARLAGIMAAKQTSSLIPLCHGLPLESVRVDFRSSTPDRLQIEAEVRTTAKTGVEMEALTAVSVAALTVYDMCKSRDRTMVIEDIRLVSKTGGQSGDFQGKLPVHAEDVPGTMAGDSDIEVLSQHEAR